MELMFNKEGSKWVAEFKATSDFNLHIERDLKGFLFLKQRTAEGGEYDSTSNASFAPMDSVVDYDFTGLVYPKFIKIVSEVEPTYAAVTSSGEVTEIKSQSKEIEVTSNGTMNITPDTGFAYLNSVKVKTNVASSGGVSRNIKYYDLSGAALDVKQGMPMYALMMKYNIEGSKSICGFGQLLSFSMNDSLSGMAESAVAGAFDFDAVFVIGADGQMKTSDLITPELIAELGLPEITEEEFYNIN